MNFEQYLRGPGLFNRREFFEAHEALEDVWRATLGPDRKFLQGLIQVAWRFTIMAGEIWWVRGRC